jgi:hypothetical protein
MTIGEVNFSTLPVYLLTVLYFFASIFLLRHFAFFTPSSLIEQQNTILFIHTNHGQ